MTPGPEEAAAGRGHLRAAHTDREHVIAVLKTAFAQGRLTKDEFDARVGRTLASRTYSDLAALTADIPAGSAVSAGPAVPAGSVDVEPPRQAARTLAKASCRSGVCILVAVALTEGAFLANSSLLILLAFFAVMAASGFFGYGVVDAWQQRRSCGQPRERPGHPAWPAAG